MYEFSYHRPASVADAATLLASHEEAKLLAGGQTYLPTLKQRLAQPSDLIDLGGIAQGIGQALLEQCVYDPETAQLITGSFTDYAMPRADDMPELKLDTICTPCLHNPLGTKGCGEAGAIGSPPAVINAITNAIGVRVEMPATPEKVWRAINAS